MEQNLNPVTSISEWTAFLTFIVAFCALISPILTALCNNWHQREMKRLEYKHQEREELKKREREIYDGYLRSAGAVLQYKTPETLRDFGEHSRLAMYYVPTDIREKMLLFEKLIENAYPNDCGFAQRANLLDDIVVMMRDIREQQSKQSQQQSNKADTSS
jgi:hypothetical protein